MSHDFKLCRFFFLDFFPPTLEECIAENCFSLSFSLFWSVFLCGVFLYLCLEIKPFPLIWTVCLCVFVFVHCCKDIWLTPTQSWCPSVCLCLFVVLIVAVDISNGFLFYSHTKYLVPCVSVVKRNMEGRRKIIFKQQRGKLVQFLKIYLSIFVDFYVFQKEASFKSERNGSWLSPAAGVECCFCPFIVLAK